MRTSRLLPVPRSIRREVQADRMIIRRLWREGGGLVAWFFIAVIWNFVLYAMYRTGQFGPASKWASGLTPWERGEPTQGSDVEGPELS